MLTEWFSRSTAREQLGRRTLDRTRWSAWADIKHFRNRVLKRGPAYSALFGIKLSLDACQVDHHPRKLRHSADGYLMLMCHESAPSPDCWSDWGDWVE